MFPRVANSRNLNLLALTAAGVCTALAATACTSGAGSNTAASKRPKESSSSAPRGVVTVQEASKLLTAYENANNRANKTRSAKVLATVESGQLNAQSQADYQQFKTWPKKQQDYYGSPFRYTNRTYIIPKANTATWFAIKATATGSANKNPSLLIFDKIDQTYKMVLAVYVEKGPIPAVAVDKDGFAEIADPAKSVGSLSPNELAIAFEDLAETGGKKTGSKLAPTAAAKDSLALFTGREKRNDSRYATTRYFATQVKASKIYALRLGDRGVLALFPCAHTQETLLRPAYRSSYKMNPDKQEALYNPAGRTVITDEFQGQALATLTPSNKAHILAAEYRMVDSR